MHEPAVPQPLRWRVVVKLHGRLDASQPARPLAWHLADCADPVLPEAHCAEGQQLLAAGGDPDGHCLVDDTCPRCAGQDAEAAERGLSVGGLKVH
jgi:hypothetical protein